MEDVIKMEDTSPISVLPPEILSQIFKFLPLADRKSVKLACRLCYDSCICASITKRERYVFRAGSRITDIVDFLLRSTCQLLDLEFQCLPVDQLQGNVWKTCGQRIRMLEFYECEWNEETIWNIILHCENLTSFVVGTSQLQEHREWTRDRRQYLYSLNLLNGLIEKGIRRPNLHTLSICISCVEVPEGTFSRIFLIHPCIKHFTLRMGCGQKYPSPCLTLMLLLRPGSVSEDAYSCMFMKPDQWFNPSDTQLESLKYNVVTDGEWMETLIDKAERGLRLRHFETELVYKRSKKHTVFNFFKSQRNLEVIKLSIGEARQDKIKELLFQILESCPNLREFCLSASPYYLTRSDVPRFVAAISKLNTLRFRFNLYIDEAASLFQNLLPNPVQLNLTSLEWKQNHDSDPDLCVALLSRCPSLQHLHIARCSDTTLQIIFQYLPDLETLILGRIDSCTDFGFTGRDVDGNEEGYSIKRLQKLKYLELSCWAYELTEKCALELRLPRLEFLSLDITWYKNLSKEVLNQLASYFPELRVLAINFNRNEEVRCMKEIIEFCQQLKNLQRLIIHPLFHGACFHRHDVFGKLESKQVGSIFNACHCLRHISWAKTWTFYRDPYTGEVVRSRWGILKFPGNVFKDEPV